MGGLFGNFFSQPEIDASGANEFKPPSFWQKLFDREGAERINDANFKYKITSRDLKDKLSKEEELARFKNSMAVDEHVRKAEVDYVTKNGAFPSQEARDAFRESTKNGVVELAKADMEAKIAERKANLALNNKTQATATGQTGREVAENTLGTEEAKQKLFRLPGQYDVLNSKDKMEWDDLQDSLDNSALRHSTTFNELSAQNVKAKEFLAGGAMRDKERQLKYDASRMNFDVANQRNPYLQTILENQASGSGQRVMSPGQELKDVKTGQTVLQGQPKNPLAAMIGGVGKSTLPATNTVIPAVQTGLEVKGLDQAVLEMIKKLHKDRYGEELVIPGTTIPAQ